MTETRGGVGMDSPLAAQESATKVQHTPHSVFKRFCQPDAWREKAISHLNGSQFAPQDRRQFRVMIVQANLFSDCLDEATPLFVGVDTALRAGVSAVNRKRFGNVCHMGGPQQCTHSEIPVLMIAEHWIETNRRRLEKGTLEEKTVKRDAQGVLPPLRQFMARTAAVHLRRDARFRQGKGWVRTRAIVVAVADTLT